MNDMQMLRQLRNAVIMAILLAVLAAAAGVLRLVALAILLSFILAPIASSVERRRVPRVAAVLITIALALGTTGILGYVVLSQVASLASDLPRYEANILKKVEALRFLGNSPLARLNEVAEHVQERLEPSKPVSDVQVVKRLTPFDRFQELLSPAARWSESVFVCLFLVLLILLERDDLGHRLIKLGGRRQIGVTTRTVAQIGARLSRYLASFSLVNLATGVSVGIGLWLIGLPYAVLWGVLGGVLRYIPFVGPTAAFFLPVLFSIAHFDNLHQPALVIGWYLTIEVVTSVLEPYLYGKTTGISAVGLFLSAVLWTWLWGPLGLLMATPMTVCLVVIGKSIPALGLFPTLLSDDIAIRLDERLYQHIVRHDHDAAIALLEETLDPMPLDELFDMAVIPALGRAREEVSSGLLSRNEWYETESVLTDWIDELSARCEVMGSLPSHVALSSGAGAQEPVAARIVGVATEEGFDNVALIMMNVLLRPYCVEAKIIDVKSSPLVLGEAIAAEKPDLLIVSHLPSGGLTRIRYLLKRLQASIGDLPVVVGIWDQSLDLAKMRSSLRLVGTWRVALSLAQARKEVVEYLKSAYAEDRSVLSPLA